MNKGIVAVVLLVAGIGVSSAFALDTMGPPAAGIGKGMWGVGVNYSYSDEKLERLPANFSSADNVVKTRISKLYVDLGYGVSDNVDAFARLGIAAMEWEEIGGSRLVPEGEDGDLGLVWGGGVKMTFCQEGDLSWGMLAQFSENDLQGDTKFNDGSKGKFRILLDEIQVAAGPTWKASEKVKVYGGPFLYLARGDWEDELDDGDELHKPIKEDAGAWLGAYVGASVELASNMGLNIEGQITQSAWAITGGVNWKF